MASIGTQRNGLPVECTFDTIGVHDYADTNTWPAVDNSSWTLNPSDESSEYHNKVIKITEMQLDLSEDVVMHAAGNLVVEFFMTGNPNPVKTIYYKSIADWISKAMEKKKFDNQSNIGPYFQYNILFSDPPIFWTSAGIDAQGSPKLNKMVIRIADNQPYKNEAGTAPAKIARPRYFAEVYNDPDV